MSAFDGRSAIVVGGVRGIGAAGVRTSTKDVSMSSLTACSNRKVRRWPNQWGRKRCSGIST